MGAAAEVIEVHVPVSAPQLRPLPDSLRGLARQQMEPLRAIADGREAAALNAADVEGLRAVLRYPYTPGVVFTAVTSPGYVTTIELEAGEQLVTAAAGDTTRWVVESVETGSGESAATLILVKPRQAFLQTNLVVTTDRRVYHLDLTSVDVPVYNTAIAWDYPRNPRNALIALQAEQDEGDRERREVVAANVAADALNFDYTVRGLGKASRRPPRWMPTRVFDDGRKTYIEFPPGLGTTEAPPLFVLAQDDSDTAQLVNYRLRGRFYVVDRLFDQAELRLGTPPSRQTVVRITREAREPNGRRSPRRQLGPRHR
ncbi:MAG: P-type conjugative transfer protein TrbG [Planctomycetota bacterium]